MLLGQELIHHPGYSRLEKLYIRLFGVPIVGLRIRARNVFSLIPRNRHYSQILDAGSGPGVISFELGKRYSGSSVLGIDLLEQSVSDANSVRDEIGADNVRFEVGDLIRMPVEDRFDLVTCVDILEHIEDDVAAIGAIHRVLAPRGIAVIHVPALHRRYPVLKKSLNFDVETHVRTGYELEPFCEKIRSAGFVIRESGYTYGFLETLANNLSYMITRARMQNKVAYAFAFPFLNAISWLGARARPKRLGAGLYVVAEKPLSSAAAQPRAA